MPETEEQKASREFFEALTDDQLGSLREMVERMKEQVADPDPPDFPERILTTILVRSWERDGHAIPDGCPVCGGPTRSIGITKLVYGFTTCSCGEPEYDHLVETLYHSVCYGIDRCPEYVPWRVRGKRTAPADCQRCGRLLDAHTQPEDGS